MDNKELSFVYKIFRCLFQFGVSTMNAIILAAGKSSRMKKDGYDSPKPLLPILGLPNIERTILMLHQFGIQEIVIVCGSEDFEAYCYLQRKYGCQIIQSHLHLNTLHSMSLVLDKMDDTFVIEGDVVLAKNIFIKSSTSFYYTTRYESCETDAWCPTIDDSKIIGFKIGSTSMPCIFGVSFWAHKDCPTIISELNQFYTNEHFRDKNLFWDDHIATILDRLCLGIYEISSREACEMNTGQEYLFAQKMCAQYYHNCERFMLDFKNSLKTQHPVMELAFVKDLTVCQEWQLRLLKYVGGSAGYLCDSPTPFVFNKGEHPFMVKDTRIGEYVAYFDVAESSEYILLRRLFVDKRYRRQGIGSRIVNYIKLYATLSNKEMRVNIYEKEAEHFYSALGMRLYFKTFRFLMEDCI